MNRRRPADAPDDRPVRWGLGDFVWIYLVGLLLGAVLGQIGRAIAGDPVGEVGALGTAFAAIGQFGGWVALIAVVARSKGHSLQEDFGVTLDVADWWAVFAGMGIFLVSSLLIALPVSLVNESQKVVQDLESATGAKLAVFAVIAALVAPFCEEVLFRGLLLRSLRRRMPPVWAIGVQALVFALAHPLLSPTLGDLAVVPGLFLLGLVSGVLAEQKGDLSRSILLHIGFNLITVVSIAL